MRIAVTYDNGNIFQHFGKTENFKVYEVENNQVISSEVISSNGSGHGALAGLLDGQNVDVLICGGMAAVHRQLSQRLGSSFVQEPREMQIRLWKLI